MKTLLICRTSYHIPHQSPRAGLKCHEKSGKNKLLGISRLWGKISLFFIFCIQNNLNYVYHKVQQNKTIQLPLWYQYCENTHKK